MASAGATGSIILPARPALNLYMKIKFSAWVTENALLFS